MGNEPTTIRRRRVIRHKDKFMEERTPGEPWDGKQEAPQDRQFEPWDGKHEADWTPVPDRAK